MSGRYVPPGLRNRPEESGEATSGKASSAGSEPIGFTVREIQRHYWGSDYDLQQDNNALASDPDKAAVSHEDGSDPISTGKSQTPGHTTLNASTESPDTLSHILLFHGANPRWETDKIIYTKSNLKILSQQKTAPASNVVDSKTGGSEYTASANASAAVNSKDQASGINTKTDNDESQTAPFIVTADRPVAVFAATQPGNNARLSFAGYHQIDKLQILEPHSEELVRMLEQKWARSYKGGTRTAQRTASSWQSSLSHTWAVIKLVVDEHAQHHLPPPKIDRLPVEDPQGERKSVNELLNELRVQ